MELSQLPSTGNIELSQFPSTRNIELSQFPSIGNIESLYREHRAVTVSLCSLSSMFPVLYVPCIGRELSQFPSTRNIELPSAAMFGPG